MRTPLQPDEKVILINYTSWVKLIVPVLVLIIGFVAAYFIGFSQWGWIAAVVALGYAVLKYFEWKVDIWVVTNYRVIDESGLFSHFAKESPLEKINNVSYDQSLWGRILNFGHVEIQTAAEVGATDYFDVHKPKRLKDTITLAQAEYKNIQLGNQAKQMAAAMGLHTTNNTATHQSSSSHSIASELEKLFQLKQQGILTEEEYNKAKNRLLS